MVIASSSSMATSSSSVDRGWAWFVLIGAVLWNVTVSGTLKSFGILYMEFMAFYETSPAQTGSIGFTFSFMMLVLAPVSGYLSDRVSCRCIMLVGGVIAASGVFLTGFAQSLAMATVTYGVIAGGAVGLMDGPVFTMLNKYFRSKRGFANSLAFVGSGIGAFCLPILLRVTTDAYSIQGTMFILAGLWLHACVIGALFRPIVLRGPEIGHVVGERTRDHKEGVEQNEDTAYKECDSKEVIENGANIEGVAQSGNYGTYTKCESGKDCAAVKLLDKGSKHVPDSMSNNKDDCERLGNGDITKCSRNLSEKSEIPKQDVPSHNSAPAVSNGTNKYTDNYQSEENCMLYSIDSINTTECNSDGIDKDSCRQVKNTVVSNGFDGCNDVSNSNPTLNEPNITSSVVYKEPNMIRSKEEQLHMITNSQINSNPALNRHIQQAHSSATYSIFQGIKHYLHFLNNPQMIRTTLAVMFGSFAYFNQMFLFPSLAEELGFTKLEGAYLVSLPGLAEIASRIPLGLLSDIKHVNKPLLVAILSSLCCVLGLTITFVATATKAALLGYALLLGVLGGTFVPLGMPMLTECVRIEEIGSASGLFLLAMSSAFALGPPVFGFLCELLGSYLVCFRICISFYIPAISLLLINAVVIHRKRKKSMNAENMDHKL